ncbi:DUF3298 and DUF4163 domain-containing protein [Erythrobacter sp. GH1-10]|uniref:DUF3298 and DUF4163 domain-containing protein n=1 Tax=Erythrobacter sp. GH1-10 TaxID=3349334 RepID=UPI003877A6C1
MMKVSTFAAAALNIAACSAPDQIAEKTGVAVASAQESGAEAESGRYEFKDSETVEGGERNFLYAWPKTVADIPKLAAELDERRKNALAEQKDYWADAIESCPEDAIACRNSEFELEWKVVADTPRFLSLSNGMYTYSGGAHGMYGRGALVWDREAERSMNPLEFFTTSQALDDAIGAAACDALNEERAERRGEPVPDGASEWPNQCVSMEETGIFLGSSDGQVFDSIEVYYGPYVAGAYAEGDFQFTLPVTQAVLDAVEPGYRAAFAIK